MPAKASYPSNSMNPAEDLMVFYSTGHFHFVELLDWHHVRHALIDKGDDGLRKARLLYSKFTEAKKRLFTQQLVPSLVDGQCSMFNLLSSDDGRFGKCASSNEHQVVKNVDILYNPTFGQTFE
jgi:hypothetical protein